MKEKRRKILSAVALEILFLLGLIAIDLLTKAGMQALLENNSTGLAAWKGILEFVYVKNYGASFGVFSGNSFILIGMPVIIGVIILALLYMNPDTPKLMRYSLLTILGGAIGNLVDRIALGFVRDFIDYKFLDTWFGINFAIGNVADLFCILGVFMFIVYMILGYKDGDFKKALDYKSWGRLING